MADFASFLPLSNRPRGGEENVFPDRRALVAEVLEQSATIARAADTSTTPALLARFADTAGLARELGPAPTADSVAELAARTRSGGKRSIRHLVRATRALLELGSVTGSAVVLSPHTSGAVTLWAATSGPHDRRAVLRGHCLRAIDAGWEFGRGPVLEGRAVDIAAFGLGTSDIPPAPPRTLEE
jgi:hypothetical protein